MGEYDNTTTPNNLSVTNIRADLTPLLDYSSSRWHYFVGTVLGIFAIIGLLQNSAVLLAVRSQHNGKRSGAFTQALLVTDLLMCALSLPFAVVSSFARRWLFGAAGCDWYAFSMSLLGLFNIHLLTAISIERYLTVMGQHTTPMVLSKRAVRGTLITCFILSLVWSILPLVGISSFAQEGLRTSCGINWASRDPDHFIYCLLILLFCFVVPFVTIAGCYTKIYLKVSSIAWSAAVAQQSQVMQRRLKTELHLAKMIFVASGSFLLVWAPYATVALLHLFRDLTTVNPIALSIPAVFAKSSVFGNSLVYICMNRRIRETIIQKYKTLIGLLPANFTASLVNQVAHEQQAEPQVAVVGLEVGPAREACVT